MSITRWKLSYGWDGPLFYETVGPRHSEIPENAEVVLARDYDSLRAAYDQLKAEHEELQKRLSSQRRRTNTGFSAACGVSL